LVEDEVFSHFIDASYGSIYPALTKMLNEGLVSVRAEEQAGKPDKKVYSITDAGREELAAALAVDPVADKFKSEFLFQVMLREFLPKSHIADIYDAQMQYLRAGGLHLPQPCAPGYGICCRLWPGLSVCRFEISRRAQARNYRTGSD